MVMMFEFIWAISFYTSNLLKSTHTSSILPFPTILALWDIWIYVCTPNSSDVATNVKASVYKSFSLCISQISIHMIDMSDFGKTLITLDLNCYKTKVWTDFGRDRVRVKR